MKKKMEFFFYFSTDFEKKGIITLWPLDRRGVPITNRTSLILDQTLLMLDQTLLILDQIPLMLESDLAYAGSDSAYTGSDSAYTRPDSTLLWGEGGGYPLSLTFTSVDLERCLIYQTRVFLGC